MTDARARPADGGLRIVVLGYVVGFPLGGMSWHTLQYPMGLADLGHDVWVVEDSNDWENCYDPSTGMVSTDATYGLAYARDTFDRVGLGDRWAYFHALEDRWSGPAADRILDVCASADAVLNVAGIHPLRPWLAEVPHRVFIDADPAFTQIRNLTEPGAHDHASAHTAHATFGELIPTGGSDVPDDGFHWVATRQPVVLDAWAPSPPPADGSLTTVMQWNSYSHRSYGGVDYGMKSASFWPYLDLPRRVAPTLEVALGRGRDHVGDLQRHGWVVTDPQDATLDPWVYQDYLSASLGEWGVAKHGYVVSRSGWFSERTASYLALGRPAVVQDTGFSDLLPTGEGLHAFDDPEGAAAAIDEVSSDPARHGRAARAVVEEHFDARRVLDRLLADTVPA